MVNCSQSNFDNPFFARNRMVPGPDLSFIRFSGSRSLLEENRSKPVSTAFRTRRSADTADSRFGEEECARSILARAGLDASARLADVVRPGGFLITGKGEQRLGLLNLIRERRSVFRKLGEGHDD